MSKSFPAVRDTCTRSGGMSDNGIRRGLDIVRKWTDGRIVKDDTMGRGAHPVVPRTLCATETPDEEPRTMPLCTRGGGSRGSCAVGAGGRSRGTRDREREVVDSLGSDQAMRGRSDDEFIEGSEDENPSVAGVWEGKMRTLRGPGVRSRVETGSALVPVG